MCSVECEKPLSAFDSEMWIKRAHGGDGGGYGELGWVNARGSLDRLIELADLRGGEIVLDIGTGNQVIAKALSESQKSVKVYGFDVSQDMMNIGIDGSIPLFVADAYRIPLSDNTVDLATARMVFHHLEDPSVAIKEAHRVLKSGGRLIVGEYVATDNDVWEFERRVFDIKEPSRHLWTSMQLKELVGSSWQSNRDLQLGYGVMPQYSVRDWMGKSGLSQEIQDEVLGCYLKAPQAIRDKMGIKYTEDGDALVDRPFAFVVAKK